MRFKWQGLSALLAVVLGVAVSVLAQEPPAEPPKDAAATGAKDAAAAAQAAAVAEIKDAIKDESWKADREKLKAIIDQRVQTEVARLVNPRDVAQKMQLAYPVEAPTKTPAEVDADVKVRVTAATDEKFPMGVVETFRKEGQEKFKLTQIGDKVSFTIRGGKGMNTMVEGRLQTITEVRIKVGSRWVVREDINEDDQARLDPELNKAQVERYIKAQTNKYNIQRDDFSKEMAHKLKIELMQKSGYQSVDKGKTWISSKDRFDREVAQRRRQETDRVRAEVEKQVYTENGYVLYEGEWVPKSVFEAIKEKVAKLLEEKKAAEGAGQAQGNPFEGGSPASGQSGTGMMGPGGPGMMGPGGPGMMKPGQGGSGPPAGMMGPGGPGMMKPGQGGSGPPAGMMGPGGGSGPGMGPQGSGAAPAQGAQGTATTTEAAAPPAGGEKKADGGGLFNEKQ